jgi:iron complex outermembrane recepter protein
VARQILLVLIIVISLPAFAQDRKDCSQIVRGRVFDLHESYPLPGALVQIGERGTVTDHEGVFEVENLCPGILTFSVSFQGYKYFTQTVVLPSQELKIFMIRAEVELSEIVVEDLRRAMGESITYSVISAADIQKVSGKPLGEAIKGIPGISTIQTGPAISKPIIHGLHSQRIVMVNNGIRQEGQQWGVEHAPEIDPMVAGNITVVKGSAALRYGGDAMAGVILIDPPSLHDSEGLGGEVHLGGMTNGRMGLASALLEGGSEKSGIGWRVQGTWKKAGDFSAANYLLTNTGLEERNFSAALGYKNGTKGAELYVSSFNTEIGILKAAHIGNLTDLEAAIYRERPMIVDPFSYNIDNPRQKINHHLVKLKGYKELESMGTMHVTYASQWNIREEYDIRRREFNNRPAMSLDLGAHTGDVVLDHLPIGKLKGTVGINTMYKRNRNVPGTGVTPLIPNYDQVNLGLFITETYPLGSWDVEGGFRYDFQHLGVKTFTIDRELVNPIFTFHNLTASLGAHRDFTNNSRFDVHIGTSARPPHTSELFSQGLHHGLASLEFGLLMQGEPPLSSQLSEKDVQVEHAVKWVNTYTHRKNATELQITAFQHWIKNYIYLSPSEIRQTIRGAFPVFNFSQTNASLTGADVFWSQALSSKWTNEVKASYVHGRDVSRGDVLIFMPPGRIEEKIGYHVPTWGKAKDVYVQAGVLHVFRQTRGPRIVEIQELRDNPETFNGNDFVFDFKELPKAYTLVQVEAGMRVPVGDNHLMVSLSAENLLNTAYRDYMNRLRYYADDLGRNFALRIRYLFHSHD